MNAVTKSTADWVGNARANILAWWLPKGAIIATIYVPVTLRATIWSIALIWMGMACILNARRCGRTHCRYTGPFYLAMVAPTLLLASGVASVGFYAWSALAAFIIFGGLLIWWATERVWGKFT